MSLFYRPEVVIMCRLARIFFYIFFNFYLKQCNISGNERLISWVRLLGLEFMDDDEEFLVPQIVKSLAVVSSGLVVVRQMIPHPVVCSIAVYTNLLVPISLMRQEWIDHYEEKGILVGKYRRANNKVNSLMFFQLVVIKLREFLLGVIFLLPLNMLSIMPMFL